MSIYATMFVWETSTQKSTSLLALLALADYADEITGECFPGIPALAKKLRMKERNVQALLRHLQDEGEIAIGERAGQKTASGNTNRYTLNGYKEWYQEVQKIASPRNKEVQLSVSRGATFGNQEVQEVAPKPSVEPSEPKRATKVAYPPVKSRKRWNDKHIATYWDEFGQSVESIRRAWGIKTDVITFTEMSCNEQLDFIETDMGFRRASLNPSDFGKVFNFTRQKKAWKNDLRPVDALDCITEYRNSLIPTARAIEEMPNSPIPIFTEPTPEERAELQEAMATIRPAWEAVS